MAICVMLINAKYRYVLVLKLMLRVVLKLNFDRKVVSQYRGMVLWLIMLIREKWEKKNVFYHLERIFDIYFI